MQVGLCWSTWQGITLTAADQDDAVAVVGAGDVHEEPGDGGRGSSRGHFFVLACVGHRQGSPRGRRSTLGASQSTTASLASAGMRRRTPSGSPSVARRPLPPTASAAGGHDTLHYTDRRTGRHRQPLIIERTERAGPSSPRPRSPPSGSGAWPACRRPSPARPSPVHSPRTCPLGRVLPATEKRTVTDDGVDDTPLRLRSSVAEPTKPQSPDAVPRRSGGSRSLRAAPGALLRCISGWTSLDVS